jgi:hypothetical protein
MYSASSLVLLRTCILVVYYEQPKDPIGGEYHVHAHALSIALGHIPQVLMYSVVSSLGLHEIPLARMAVSKFVW